jgi:hypothetical protein
MRTWFFVLVCRIDLLRKRFSSRAQKRHLLLKQVQWHDWRRLVEELDTEHIYDRIDALYIYGELRPSRLNKIQYLHFNIAFRGYMPSYNRYNDFFYDNFTWLASVTVYIAIVLTAMQVGLATEALAKNRVFQPASYGLTLFYYRSACRSRPDYLYLYTTHCTFLRLTTCAFML